MAIDKINFTSKLICLDKSIATNWEIKGFNIESIKVIEICGIIFIFAGTTKGKLLIIEEKTGRILINIRRKSCLNMLQILVEKQLLFSCHDDGTVVTIN